MFSRGYLLWLVPLAALVVRIAYALWWSPYEIVADEAQYWDWSRHLQWSYFERGPGIAWVIAAATHALGSSLWAIRVPAAIFGTVTMIAVAALAREPGSGSHGSRRNTEVGVASIFLFCLIPAFQLSSLLMTPDAAYFMCWAIAAWAGWRALQREFEGRPSVSLWIACACGIGAALLFNYAAVMLVASLAGFIYTTKHRVLSPRAGLRLGLAALIVLIWLAPVIVWNVQHDGAAFVHMRGYLRLPGGIWPARPLWTFNPIWTAEYVAGTLAIIGPSVGLMWLGYRGRQDDHTRWLVWCAAPLLTVFLLASVRTRIEGNWPVPAFLTLIPLAARGVVDTSGTQNVFSWWRASIAYGVVTAIFIHAPLMTAGLPLIGRFVPVERFAGMAAAVAELAPVVKTFREGFGANALIVAPSHNDAGRISFYLPGQPLVRSAGQFFGERRSSYDFFADTALTAPAAQGKPALLIGRSAEAWRATFDVEGLDVLDPPWVSRVAQFRVRSRPTP